MPDQWQLLVLSISHFGNLFFFFMGETPSTERYKVLGGKWFFFLKPSIYLHIIFSKGFLKSSYFQLLQSKEWKGASLVAQWLRIRLPVQGTRVPALVREDPTCRGATKPVPQLLSLRSRAREPQLLKPWSLESMLCNKRNHHNEKPAHRNGRVAPARPPLAPRSLQLEKARTQQQRPNAAKNKQIK